jgi:hypothetical protein
MSNDDIVRLGATGNVYVTLAAARTYAEEYGLQEEEARRELTVHLLDASRPASDQAREGGTELWRRRNRSSGIDISATVVRSGRLAVVVAVNVRDHVGSLGRDR